MSQTERGSSAQEQKVTEVQAPVVKAVELNGTAASNRPERRGKVKRYGNVLGRVALMTTLIVPTGATLVACGQEVVPAPGGVAAQVNSGQQEEKSKDDGTGKPIPFGDPTGDKKSPTAGFNTGIGALDGDKQGAVSDGKGGFKPGENAATVTAKAVASKDAQNKNEGLKKRTEILNGHKVIYVSRRLTPAEYRASTDLYMIPEKDSGLEGEVFDKLLTLSRNIPGEVISYEIGGSIVQGTAVYDPKAKSHVNARLETKSGPSDVDIQLIIDYRQLTGKSKPDFDDKTKNSNSGFPQNRLDAIKGKTRQQLMNEGNTKAADDHRAFTRITSVTLKFTDAEQKAIDKLVAQQTQVLSKALGLPQDLISLNYVILSPDLITTTFAKIVEDSNNVKAVLGKGYKVEELSINLFYGMETVFGLNLGDRNLSYRNIIVDEMKKLDPQLREKVWQTMRNSIVIPHEAYNNKYFPKTFDEVLKYFGY